HTLPKGALQGLMALSTRGDIGGVGRAVAIVLGLAVTTVGYLRGRLAGRLSTESTMRTAQPHFAVKELAQ
ncbi:MAG: hypothetical protein KDE31_33065, partial [Caldilineaceae bacterium]|nr:hypothetical protein [Caldilineaceae bacterium]